MFLHLTRRSRPNHSLALSCCTILMFRDCGITTQFHSSILWRLPCCTIPMFHDCGSGMEGPRATNLMLPSEYTLPHQGLHQASSNLSPSPISPKILSPDEPSSLCLMSSTASLCTNLPYLGEFCSWVTISYCHNRLRFSALLKTMLCLSRQYLSK
jgi:hypothetical protein